MIVDITRISAWFSGTIQPWVNVIFEENPHLKYLFILLVVLIIVLICIRRKKVSKAKKGGYRNFQGDIWYPDGRIWHEKTKTWEEPDFKNADKNNG